MDGELSTVIELQDDNLEEVARPIRSNVKDPKGPIVVLHFVADQRIPDGVTDVGVLDAVLPGRFVDLQTRSPMAS